MCAAGHNPPDRVGGPAGVDRAALDFAISRGIDHGGWVPKGRKAEDGSLPAVYHVVETKTATYAERTRKNVRDSEGTLIIHEGRLSGGTALTEALARRLDKPALAIDLSMVTTDDAACLIRDWIMQNRISVLNIAGPEHHKSRESTIEAATFWIGYGGRSTHEGSVPHSLLRPYFHGFPDATFLAITTPRLMTRSDASGRARAPIADNCVSVLLPGRPQISPLPLCSATVSVGECHRLRPSSTAGPQPPDSDVQGRR